MLKVTRVPDLAAIHAAAETKLRTCSFQWEDFFYLLEWSEEFDERMARPVWFQGLVENLLDHPRIETLKEGKSVNFEVDSEKTFKGYATRWSLRVT